MGDEQRTAGPRTYRVRSGPGVAGGVVLAYIIVVFGLQYATGLDYTEWVDTPEHGLRAGVVPLAAGSALLIAFVTWSRWDMVWRDPDRLPMSRAMWVAVWYFVLAVAGLVQIALLLVGIVVGVVAVMAVWRRSRDLVVAPDGTTTLDGGRLDGLR